MTTAGSRVISRIPIVGGGAATVECLVQEAGIRELRAWQRHIHAPYIAPDARRLDRDWNWPRFLLASYVLNDVSGRLTEAFQIVVEARGGQPVPVGLAMLVSGYPHPGESRQSSTFVWYLASTPAKALNAVGVPHRFLVLPLLLDTAVQASRWQGYGGRVALHADHRGTKTQQEALITKYARCGLRRQAHLRGFFLSLFRRMDERYFVYGQASAHACTLKWNYLR